MLMIDKAMEYFDLWEADHDPIHAKKTYEELLNKSEDGIGMITNRLAFMR